MKEIFSVNKKARFDFITVKELQVGLVLEGPEVRAIREGRMNLKGSYCKIIKNEIFLINSSISLSENIPSWFTDSYKDTRDRKLLCTKKEILKLQKEAQEKGFTLILDSVFQPKDSRFIKGILRLVKGASNYDKRNSLKEKDQKRDTERYLKTLKDLS